MLNSERVILNLVQNLQGIPARDRQAMKSICYETLKRVQGDRIYLTTQSPIGTMWQ
jgi:hypothetical protein